MLVSIMAGTGAVPDSCPVGPVRRRAKELAQSALAVPGGESPLCDAQKGF